MKYRNTINYQLCLGTLIYKIYKRLEDEIRIDLSLMKRILLTDSILIIIFTIIYFTCFGCFLVTSNPTVKTVTLRSEGPAAEMYPDSMGEFQLAEVINRWVGKREKYQHRSRCDRCLMYNDYGNNAFPI